MKRENRLIGPSEHLPDSRRACQRSVNLCLAKGEGAGEDRRLYLKGTPGLTQLVDLSKTIRSMYVAEGRWFALADDTLYEVSTAGTTVNRGLIATDRGIAAMKHGSGQLCIVDGPNGYVFDLTGGALARITDPDWQGSEWVEWLDGYFVFVRPGTEQFYISAIDAASDIDALDFTSDDAQPDAIVTHRVLKGELVMLGTRTAAIYVNSAGEDFPFARYTSSPIDVGCVGRRAAVTTTDSLVFVGATSSGRGYVYEMQGHQPIRISTEAVESALATSTDLSEAAMWTYQTIGAEYVGVNAPGMETTWVFDLATRAWHERGELDAEDSGQWAPLRAEHVVHIDGRHFCASGTVIYEITGNQIAGVDSRRERIWPHLIAGSHEPIVYRGLDLMCQTGDLSASAHITLECSNDGGRTYMAPLLRSLGADGDTTRRVRWLGLGAARDRVFRLRVTGNTDFALYSASLDAS